MRNFTLLKGDILPLRSIKKAAYTDDDGKKVIEANFVAPKGEVFICALLGTAKPAEINSFDFEAMMLERGWVRAEKAK